MTVHEYLDFFARAYGLRGAKRRSVVDSVEQFTNLKGIRDKLLRALVEGHEAAGEPGPGDGARSAGAGARRAGRRARTRGPASSCASC